jgi:hypothetical protein
MQIGFNNVFNKFNPLDSTFKSIDSKFNWLYLLWIAIAAGVILNYLKYDLTAESPKK